MYRRILAPTDFSEHSARAYEHACALARAVDAEVIVFHAFDRPHPPTLPASDAGLRSYLDRAAQEAEARLAEWASGCKDVRCRPLAAEGKPWVEILTAAHREECDLICMASHGRGALADMFVGSVTERVLHRAAAPVLVIRPPERAWKPA